MAGVLGHRGVSPGQVPSFFFLQDLEISVKELRTILNRIISKRECPRATALHPVSCLHLLIPHSSRLQDLAFSSHPGLNPTPRSLRAGTLYCFSEPCSPLFFLLSSSCWIPFSLPELQALV